MTSRRLLDRLAMRRAERENTSAVRRRRVVQSRDGVIVSVDGRDLLSFCSNDYLGLSQHADVLEAMNKAAARFGTGSTGSPLISGHFIEHAAFEQEIARWLGYERAVLFSSGYQANLAIMQALLDDGDVCVQDKLNHACLLDGVRLCGATLKRYQHLDSGGAARQLKAIDGHSVAMLATESVFSMDGDLAPLNELAYHAQVNEALLVIDEAHSIGLMGPDGRGATVAAGLSSQEAPILIIPLGKAFGGHGAVVVGNEVLIGAIIETARPYLFSTAPSPAMAAAMRVSLRIIHEQPWRRAKLNALITRYRRGAQQLGIPVLESATSIQPVLLGDNDTALTTAKVLEDKGFFVSAVRHPTVPAGKARLRITLSALHQEQDIDRLLDALAQTIKIDAQPIRPLSENYF